MKTSALIDLSLDWAVARCLGIKIKIPAYCEKPWLLQVDCHGQESHCPKWSTDWSQGGPLVERVKIDIVWEEGQPHARMSRMVQVPRGVMSWCTTKGPTPLIAAMRCLVASRLGDEVDVPKELL